MSKAVPINKKLYEKVKKEAKKKFTKYPSIYANAWVVREYKKRGGKYDGKKTKSSGLKRWFKEDWVDLNRPQKNSKGEIVGYAKCGRASVKKGKYPLCRPSKRISSKTPRTYQEISKHSIEKAKRQKSKVKHKNNIQFGKGMLGGKPQFYGKKSSVMVKVPSNVKKWANYAFKLRKLGFQGATETGWKRAKQLATKDEIPIEDIRYMHAWFSRHIYTSYPGFMKWMEAGRPKEKQWHNKRSIISILTWGGPAGLKWMNTQKVLSLLSKTFNKEYKPIKMKK
jgi:hypothetical protein